MSGIVLSCRRIGHPRCARLSLLLITLIVIKIERLCYGVLPKSTLGSDDGFQWQIVTALREILNLMYSFF